MNHFGLLLMMLLLLALAAPALTADSATLSNEEPGAELYSTAVNDKNPGSTTETGSNTVAAQVTKDTALPARPVSKERSRRPARIDLTMPYYRFGRLPIRVKD
jgi:hypothetical protein